MNQGRNRHLAPISLLALWFAVICQGSSPVSPRAVGIAAIESETGEVKWETWVDREEVSEIWPHREGRRQQAPPWFGKNEDRPFDWVFRTVDSPGSEYHMVGIARRTAPETILARFPVLKKQPDPPPSLGLRFAALQDGRIVQFEGAVDPDGKEIVSKWPMRRATEFKNPGGEGSGFLYIVTGRRLFSFDAAGKKVSEAPAANWRTTPLFMEGPGFSANITDSSVFLIGTEVAAFDRATGKHRWSYRHGLHNPFQSWIDPTESPDGKRVFVSIGPEIPYTIYFGLHLDDEPAAAEREPSYYAGCAELAQVYGEGWVRRFLESRLDDPEYTAPEIRDRIREIIDSDWPEVRSARRLARFCFDRIRTDEGSIPRSLAWKALRELTPGGIPMDGSSGLEQRRYFNPHGNDIRYLEDGEIEDLIARAVSVLKSEPPDEQAAAAGFLDSEEAASRLGDGELQVMIRHEHPEVWKAGLFIYLNLGRWREAIRQLVKCAPEVQQAAIPLIYKTRDLQRGFVNRSWGAVDDNEEAFLFENYRRDPFAIAPPLSELFRVRAAPVPERFLPIARRVLEEEIEAPKKEGSEIWQVSSLLYLLSLAGDEADNPLFQRYLEHPQKRQSSHGSRPKEGAARGVREYVRHYDFPGRMSAAAILKKRNVELPEDLELTGEEIVPVEEYFAK